MKTDGRQYQAGEKTEDALAALQWLEECAAMQDSYRSGEAHTTIWKALTASGVPEEVRQLRERERQLYDALWTLDGHARLYMTLAENVDEQTTEALRNPPESELDGETAIEASGWEHEQLPTEQELCDSLSKYAPHTPEQTAEYGEITESDSDMGLPGMWEAADFVGGPDDTPEQEHGDALAALGRAEDVLSRAAPGDYQSYLQDDCELIRHRLTASGVPDEVRRLPEQMKEHADRLNDSGRPSSSWHVMQWAEKLERAIASAPADANNANVTCECERGPREIVENTDEGGTKWWTLATHCTDCLESASAPTDGGNDNG